MIPIGAEVSANLMIASATVFAVLFVLAAFAALIHFLEGHRESFADYLSQSVTFGLVALICCYVAVNLGGAQ